MKYILGILIIAAAAGGLYAVTHSKGESIANADTLTIVTSFYPLHFALERIVGEEGTVINIGAGVDPHDFEPTARDIADMLEADLVVLHGAELEPWGDRVVEQLEAEDTPVYLATAALELLEATGQNHEHEGEEVRGEEEVHEGEAEDERGHGNLDPHTWLDPVLFRETVEHLTDAVAALDESNRAVYEENAAALIAELAELHNEYESRLASCQRNEVITTHDAFGYVGKRYGFEIHAIAGISTQDVPSATVLAELREEAEEGVGAILLEENSVVAYGETLARETGLSTLSVNPIAYAVPDGADYLSLMRDNLDTFSTALSCNE